MNSNPFSLEKSISLPIGSVRASDYTRDNIYIEKINKIKNDFDIESFKTHWVVCVAGNMTTLACMILELEGFSEKIHGKKFKIETIQEFCEKIRGLGPDEILKLYPYIEKRALTIVGGTQVILSLIEVMGIKEIEISIFGLRHGTLYEGKIDERFRTS
jgi:exopolyphosphatase/guanosine-5'-triphosphate,3'-diphosphate pyrophosphatase